MIVMPLVFLFCLNVKTQNLIKNPGFEKCSYAGCIPTDRVQIEYADHWNHKYYGVDANGHAYTYADLYDTSANCGNCNILIG